LIATAWQFIGQHGAGELSVYGVEPICNVLQVAPSAYRRHAARRREPSLRCPRDRRDAQLLSQIQRVWQENHGVNVRFDVLPGVSHDRMKFLSVVQDFLADVLKTRRSVTAK